MRFQTYRPRKLPGLVALIWEQESSHPLHWRILPSGWVELVFRFGPAFSLQKARRLRHDAESIRQFCFLSGLHTRPLDLVFDRFHTFGVRMHPVAVRAYAGIPCSEVRDEAIGGDLLFADLNRIEDHLRSAPDFRTRALWMERELCRRLHRSERPQTALKMWKLSRQMPIGSPNPVRTLCRQLGYSRTHMHRLCREWFGQSATEVVRLTRFVRATEAIHRNAGSLTEIGYQQGYFDQSHFIRDFREFSGMTPGAYQQRKGPTPEQLIV